MRSTFSKSAFVDNRANLIVRVDSFLSCHNLQFKGFRIPTLEKHERYEIVSLDLQHAFDGMRLEFSIYVKDLFHDLCVFLRQEWDRDRAARSWVIRWGGGGKERG